MASNILFITQQIRNLPNTSSATQALLDWITSEYGTAYLMLDDTLTISDNTERNPDFVRWVSDRNNWRNLQQAEQMSGALFVPLIFGGRTQGVLAVDNPDDEAFQLIPLVELLATRLDSEVTALMMVRARQLVDDINQETQLDAMLQLAVKGLIPILDVAVALIFKFAPDELHGKSIAEYPSRVTLGRNMGATDYIAFKKLFKNGIYSFSDENNNVIAQEVRTAMRTVGTKQILAAPMINAGRLIGAVAVTLNVKHAQRQFNGREKQILQMITSAISSAYINLRHASYSSQDILDNNVFRQLIEKSTTAVDIHAPSGELIYRNQAWNDLFLHDASENLTFNQRLLDTDKDLPEQRIYPNATNQTPWTDLIKLKRKDNTRFDAQVSILALRDMQDNIVGYSSITSNATELNHVMKALQAQTSRLSATATVSQTIITTPELDELTESVLGLICTKFDYNSAQILLLNDDRDSLECLMACRSDGTAFSEMIGQTLSLNQSSAAQWVITNEHLLLLNDIQTDDRYHQHPELPTTGSELVLLLKANNEVLGVLIIQSEKTNIISLDDVDVMKTIADQLSVAIHNNMLFSQLRDSLDDMNAMGEVSLLVQASFDLDALTDRIYDAMRRVHSTGDFTLALFNQSDNTINSISYRNGLSERTQQVIGDDLISKMILQATPIFWRSEYERESSASYFDLPSHQIPKAFLGLPLIAKDSVLGVLYTDSNTYNDFNENDLLFMLALVNSAAFALENMRLLDDTKQRVREMEIINSISHTLSETFGMDVMWGQLLAELENLFPHGFISVALYDSKLKVLKKPKVNIQTSLLSTPPESLVKAVVDNGITLNFGDLSQEENRLENFGIDSFTLNLEALKSWIGTPLKSRNNETIGVMALQSDIPNAFSDRDLSLLNMVAAQTSLALDNGLLLRSEQERREISNSLIDMGRIMTSTLNIDDVFARIFEQVKRLLEYQRIAILIPANNVAPNEMTLYAIDGFDKDDLGQHITIQGNSPLEKIIHLQEPLTITAISESDNWSNHPDILREGVTQSWMGVPLVVQSQVIGIISLDSTPSDIYTEESSIPIFALARQAAIAIENARLHSEAESTLASLKMRTDRLTSMHDLATFVSSSLSQQAILDHTTQLLTELFPVDYASVLRIDIFDGHGYLVAEYPASDLIGSILLEKNSPEYDAFQEIVQQNTAVHIQHDDILSNLSHKADFAGGHIIAPLIANEQILGLITLGIADKAIHFDDENLETLMTIVAQIAVAIRNADLLHDALEANRLKSEFLANVSHELRTPLNAIIGYSELLNSGTYGELTEKQNDRIERVYRSGQQLLTLINDILDLSKIEAGKMDLLMVELDIQSLVREAVGSVQPEADEKNLALSIDIEDNLPQIFVDSQRIRQVLANLLSNAVKFTKEGNIDIVVRRTQANLSQFPELPINIASRKNFWIHISVSDTGIGISDKDKKLVFEAFTQADGSTVREYQGTGLGLAITKRLVKMHGGYIWLESELGQGSTFNVLLPSAEMVKNETI